MGYQFIGLIKGPLGVRGSVVVANTAGTTSKLEKGVKVRIGFSEAFSDVYTIAECKVPGKTLEIRLEGINSPEAASIFKEKGLFIDEEIFKVKDSEILVGDLIGGNGVEGYKAVDKETGKELGLITDVWILPANDVWVVKMAEGTLPIPVIDDVVKKINKKKKTVEVVLIPGLMDLLEKEEDKDE